MSGKRKTFSSMPHEDDDEDLPHDAKVSFTNKLLPGSSLSFDSSANQPEGLPGISSSDDATSGGFSVSTAVALEKIAGIRKSDDTSQSSNQTLEVSVPTYTSSSSSLSRKYVPQSYEPPSQDARMLESSTDPPAYHPASSGMMDARFYRPPKISSFPHPHYQYQHPFLVQHSQHQFPQGSNLRKDVTSYYQASITGAHQLKRHTGKDSEEKKAAIGGKRPRGRPKGSTNKGKPKRPLSAYNIFFKEERARILESIPDAARTKDSGKHQRALSISSDPTDTQDTKKGGNDKKQPHGKIGFENLAKMIASRWQSLTPKELEPYTGRAKIEADRYKKELELCKTKEEDEVKKKISNATSKPSLPYAETLINRNQYNYSMFPSKEPPQNYPQETTSIPEQPISDSSVYMSKYKSPPRSVAQAKARLATVYLDKQEEGKDDESSKEWVAPLMSPIRLNPSSSFSRPRRNVTATSNSPSSASIPIRQASTSFEGSITMFGEYVRGKKSFILGQPGYALQELSSPQTQIPPRSQSDLLESSTFDGIFHGAGLAFFDSPTNSKDGNIQNQDSDRSI